MSGLIETAQGLLDNPYFGAGAGLFGIGLLATSAKKGGQYFTILARRYCLVSVEVNSKDHSYQWLLQWLARHAKHSNHMSVSTVFQQGDSGKIWTDFSFAPCPGTHFFWYRKMPMKIDRIRETQARDFSTGLPYETLTMTTIAGRSNVYEDVLKEAREAALKAHEGRTKIYVPRGSDWAEFGLSRLKRSLSSVVLETGLKEQITDDVRDFMASAEWYRRRGIPYRRGYLLHGPPGCGKSSFIASLAGEIDFSICILNLEEQIFTDDRLSHLLVHAPHESIVLLEDVDSIFRRRVPGNPADQTSPAPVYPGVSFSGLLNALDGVASSLGRLVFMTTNHPELLDPALIRPGRVDRSIYFGFVGSDQAEAMFGNFYPESTLETKLAFGKAVSHQKELTPARLQAFFMRYKNSPLDALHNANSVS